MNKRQLWSRILFVIGGIAMAIGAIDPLEGCMVILPGCGLIALSTYLDNTDRRVLLYRLWGFILVIIGIAALWLISMKGGFGGDTGRSMWWGLLFLPYFVGWSIVMWGIGSPRWLSTLGIVVGLHYILMFINMAKHDTQQDIVQAIMNNITLGIIGIITIAGSIYRWLHQPEEIAMLIPEEDAEIKAESEDSTDITEQDKINPDSPG